MGAFSPAERARRIYALDKKDGDFSGRTMLETWVSKARRNFFTGFTCLMTTVFLLSLIGREATDFKALLALILVFLTFCFLLDCVLNGLTLIEDSKILKLYREIESTEKEFENE